MKFWISCFKIRVVGVLDFDLGFPQRLLTIMIHVFQSRLGGKVLVGTMQSSDKGVTSTVRVHNVITILYAKFSEIKDINFAPGKKLRDSRQPPRI